MQTVLSREKLRNGILRKLLCLLAAVLGSAVLNDTGSLGYIVRPNTAYFPSVCYVVPAVLLYLALKHLYRERRPSFSVIQVVSAYALTVIVLLA